MYGQNKVSIKKNSLKNRYYGDVAKLYDTERFHSRRGKFIDQLEKKAIIKLINSVDNLDTVLDIPCGTGRITQLLLDLGYNVIGADVSKDMIKIAQKKLNNYDNLLDLYHCDLTNLPFENGKFDCITSIRLMGHVPQMVRVKMLREMRRVVKKCMIVSYYNPYSLKGIYRGLRSRVIKPSTKWYPISFRKLKDEVKLANLQTYKMEHILDGIAETYIVLIGKENDPMLSGG